MAMLNQQVTLKPQDVVVLLKLSLHEALFTYAGLGKGLNLAASEVHASIKRILSARLIARDADRGFLVMRPQLRDFLIYGAPYAFPPITGPLARGIPTAYAFPTLRAKLSLPDEPLPVWPYSKGSIRGVSLYPLYPSVPQAAERDLKLYEALALFDAIRIGGAREREIATSELTKFLA
jgi:hypothetical protein